MFGFLNRKTPMERAADEAAKLAKENIEIIRDVCASAGISQTEDSTMAQIAFAMYIPVTKLFYMSFQTNGRLHIETNFWFLYCGTTLNAFPHYRESPTEAQRDIKQLIIMKIIDFAGCEFAVQASPAGEMATQMQKYVSFIDMIDPDFPDKASLAAKFNILLTAAHFKALAVQFPQEVLYSPHPAKLKDQEAKGAKLVSCRDCGVREPSERLTDGLCVDCVGFRAARLEAEEALENLKGKLSPCKVCGVNELSETLTDGVCTECL